MNTVIKRAWNKNKLVKVEDLTGMTFQAESGGHTFEISGVDDTGAAVSLSGTVEGRFLRADNAEIIISGSVSGGKASVTLSAACYAIPGRFLLTVYVTSGGQKVAVYAATGSVVATSGTASGSVPPLVTDSVQANTGTFGSISTGDATVNGVLDVTQRRCYATLSSPGWYRVLTYSGYGANSYQFEGFIIHFDITTTFNNIANAAHSVDLQAVYGAIRFVGEQSAGSNIVDKIRYTVNGNYAYVDIHYTGTYDNTVGVKFNVACRQYSEYRFTANTLSSVADSPSGETVLTEYNFAANTLSPFVRQISYSGTTDANGNLEIPQNVANYNLHHYVLQYASAYATAILVSGGLLYVKCFKYNGTPYTSANVTVYLLEN